MTAVASGALSGAVEGAKKKSSKGLSAGAGAIAGAVAGAAAGAAATGPEAAANKGAAAAQPIGSTPAGTPGVGTTPGAGVSPGAATNAPGAPTPGTGATPGGRTTPTTKFKPTPPARSDLFRALMLDAQGHGKIDPTRGELMRRCWKDLIKPPPTLYSPWLLHADDKTIEAVASCINERAKPDTEIH
jgi:hypothetical protein